MWKCIQHLQSALLSLIANVFSQENVRSGDLGMLKSTLRGFVHNLMITSIILWIAIILSRIIVTFPNCPMSAGGSHSPGTIFFFVGLLIWQKTYVLFVNDVPWQPLQTYLCTGPTLMVSHHLLIWHQHQSICSQYLIYSFKTASSACIKANCCPEPLLTFSKKKKCLHQHWVPRLTALTLLLHSCD